MESLLEWLQSFFDGHEIDLNVDQDLDLDFNNPQDFDPSMLSYILNTEQLSTLDFLWEQDQSMFFMGEELDLDVDGSDIEGEEASTEPLFGKYGACFCGCGGFRGLGGQCTNCGHSFASHGT